MYEPVTTVGFSFVALVSCPHVGVVIRVVTPASSVVVRSPGCSIFLRRLPLVITFPGLRVYAELGAFYAHSRKCAREIFTGILRIRHLTVTKGVASERPVLQL